MEITIIALVLFYVATPIIILHLCHSFPFVNKLGSVIIAYIFGLILGNIGLLPSLGSYLNEFMIMNPDAGVPEIEQLVTAGLIDKSNLLAFRIYKLRDLLMSITILLAIPLILFSNNAKDWTKLAGKAFISMITGFVAVLTVIVIGFFIFRSKGMPDLWKVSGLLVGVYTGGTPNLASLKMMLNVDANTYILTHTYDLIIGVFYLAFLISIGQRLFRWFLTGTAERRKDIKLEDLNGKDPFWGIFQKKIFVPLLKAYAITIVVMATGVLLSTLVPASLQMVVVILTITTLGILISLIPAINRIEKTFESGMYLILVFSLVVASMADIRDFAGITPGLFMYITMAVFGSLILHVLLAKIFKLDPDLVMITSTALVFSPPFVPVVAGAIKNKDVIIPGITIGIIGYAVGNYMGFLIANFLKMF